MNYLIIALIKMRLLIFLAFSQYRLACKYGIILEILVYNWMQNAFSVIWRINWRAGKAIKKLD